MIFLGKKQLIGHGWKGVIKQWLTLTCRRLQVPHPFRDFWCIRLVTFLSCLAGFISVSGHQESESECFSEDLASQSVMPKQMNIWSLFNRWEDLELSTKKVNAAWGNKKINDRDPASQGSALIYLRLSYCEHGGAVETTRLPSSNLGQSLGKGQTKPKKVRGWAIFNIIQYYLELYDTGTIRGWHGMGQVIPASIYLG